MPIKVKGTEIVDDNRNIKNADGSQITGIVTSITAGENVTINQSTGNVTISADTSDTFWKKDSTGICSICKVGIETSAKSEGSLTLKNNLIFDGTTIKIGNKAGECYTESTATLPSDNSIFIGTGAGRCSYTDRAKQNIYLGYYAGNRKCSQYNIAIGECSQASCSTNSFQGFNISIGRWSLRNHLEGICNITLGDIAGQNLYYGSCNTFIGWAAGACQNPSSFGSTKCYMDCNVFIGNYVARSGFGCNNVWIAPTNLCSSSVWSGKSNVLVGSNAGRARIIGDDNVLLGSCVSHTCLGGSNNVSLGSTSSCCLIGCNNVSLGSFSSCCLAGCNNVAIGRCSSRTLKGCNNVSIGDCSSFSVSGSNNVTIGSLSLSVSDFDGCDNVSIGYSSGSIKKGCFNVFIGAYSGIRYSTCSNEHGDNVFIGKNTGGFPNPYAGDNVVYNNVFIGSNAGCRYCGNFNTIIGSNAGESFAGISNVFIGSDAGCSAGGNTNVLIGSCAGFGLGGSCNVVIGNDSFKEVSSTCAVSIGNSNFSGGNNPQNNGVYIGNDIQGGSISIGNSIGNGGNILIGNETNRGGSSLTIAIGHCAAYNIGARECSVLIGNCSNFSGSSCCSTIIGDCAGLTSSGDFNLILGNKAGCHSNHSCSVIIGHNAGNSSSQTGANNINNIIIGHNAGINTTDGLVDIADKCNTIVIGNNSITNFYTKMGTSSGGQSVKWCSVTNELFSESSSRRFKTNIRPFLGGIKETLQLNPVKYNSIEDPDGRDHIGFIAEEVDETDVKEFVIYDENQEPLAVSYDKMVALLTGAVKELYVKNTEIKERLSTLENTIQSHIENHA